MGDQQADAAAGVGSDDQWWARADHGGIVDERVGWGGLLLSVRDGLDLRTRGRLRRHLRDAVGAGVQRIVVDGGRLGDVDALTLAALVSARVGMGPSGRVAIVAVAPHAQLVIGAAGVAGGMAVFSDRDAAIAYVTGRDAEPRFARSSLILR